MVQLEEIIGGWKLVEDCWTSVDERETERRARVSSVFVCHYGWREQWCPLFGRYRHSARVFLPIFALSFQINEIFLKLSIILRSEDLSTKRKKSKKYFEYLKLILIFHTCVYNVNETSKPPIHRIL